MPEKSGFFDSTADDPREYPARDFAEYFGRILSNGVFNGGKYLNVSASGSDANVSLSTGFAWINGYVYSVYDSPLTLPIDPATTQDRIDRIVLRLDTSTQIRRIRATVIPGTP
ncbi:phage tail protein, partial [Paenibacillus azoreducens]